MKILLKYLPVLCICLSQGAIIQNHATPELYLDPIFKVNFGDATADKPQSKSWSTENGQWLVVADEDGPKLFRNDTSGWSSETEVNRAWRNLPARADVWSKGDEVHIVLVEECRLNVVKITYSQKGRQYEHQSDVDLQIPDNCHSIETATITQDAQNQYWVCADMNEKIMVWHSFDGIDWSQPITMTDGIHEDDISLIVGLKNQISVIWSNQNTQSINERIHVNGDAPDHWSETIIIQEGDKNADDHLNAAVFENGGMALVTKNSVDEINQPQFVLRLRDKNGRWTNVPYENLTAQKSPSRPVINHVQSGKIFELHSVRNRETNRYYISVNEITKNKDHWAFSELIQLKTKINGKNGDVTSSKASFLPGEAKLIFFSDDQGNIYSFDLDILLKE